jgi:hypothetical protein
MQLQLADAIKQHLNSKETGLLSVKIKGGQHLLKVYFVQGQVTNLQFGMSRNNECFRVLDTPDVESMHFMKDVRSPVQGSDTNGLTQTLCSHLGNPGLTRQGSSDALVKPDKVAQTVNDFIAIVGPIGQIALSELYDKLGHRLGDPMPGDNFFQFVTQLAAELPERHRAAYLKAHIPVI